MGKDDLLVVLVTAPDDQAAATIARTLVEEQLSACVNIVPGLRSVYRWQGEIQHDSEVLLLIKSGVALLEALTQRVRELHPYELPEVLALPVAGGFEAYLAWARGELRE